ncbi:helix-turn-helix domain-containing protein [Paucilactobacillus oligofermentans]|nr:helix-turn-helix domain-containing protein [Paucilactobacillus oligofermentans]
MFLLSKINISTPLLHISSGKFEAGANWKHKHMFHDGNFEIIIVIKGTLFLKVDGSKIIVEAGDVFSLPPFHNLEGYQDSPTGTQYFWIHFFNHPNGLKVYNLKAQDNLKIENMFTKTTCMLPLKFSLPNTDKSFILSNQLLDVVRDSYFTSLSIDYLLTELIIQLSNDYFKTLAQEEISRKDARISLIKSWIQANLSESLRVTDVANKFELNSKYLVRFFKNHTNETIIQYINRLKIQKSIELLVETNLPIKQISSLAYFSDAKQFMKDFKKYTNLTPSKYRYAYTRKFLDSSNFDPEVPIDRNPL